MPASNDSALAVAGQLRSLPDAELIEMLGAREIRESGIRDFFDLAEALLDPASIQHALGILDRPTLATLMVLSEVGRATEADAAARLAELGADTSALGSRLARTLRLALVTQRDGVYTVPGSVRYALSTADLPSLEELAVRPAPSFGAPGESRAETDRLAAEQAFTTTTALVELVTELQHEGARELVRGGMALPDEKRLAQAMNVPVASVAHLVEVADRAGLVLLENARWTITDSATDWLVDSWGERWSLLAGAWLDRLPDEIRSIFSAGSHSVWGEGLEPFLAWLYPAGGAWMRERLDPYLRDAELLGISAQHVPSSPGTALLEIGIDAAATAITALFPPEVRQVYLQHDLSIVSPGPLAPSLDSRLRTMADAEGRALASTYRVSTASLNRALAGGETEESIGEFLARISLTGIPQPLAYLVSETSARYGALRIGTIGDGPLRSYVRSTDATLLRTLLVDQGLAGLGFSRWGGPETGAHAHSNHIASRSDAETVYWALSHARYPVAAEDSNGNVVAVRRRKTVTAPA
ncbi:MAG: hypothetical protein EPN91_06345, partial [Salinibacterium sp.]